MSTPIAYKICIIGSSGVGKTSILKHYLENAFDEQSQTTIGVDFYSQNVVVDDEEVTLQIWDTAGQERFRSISISYFRNSYGALLVFDVNDESSFNSLEGWINDYHRNCIPNSRVVLIGNKTDLERKVSYQDAENFAKRHGLVYIETSAKTGGNVADAFSRLASEIHGEVKRGKIIPPVKVEDQLEDFGKQPQKGCC